MDDAELRQMIEVAEVIREEAWEIVLRCSDLIADWREGLDGYNEGDFTGEVCVLRFDAATATSP